MKKEKQKVKGKTKGKRKKTRRGWTPGRLVMQGVYSGPPRETFDAKSPLRPCVHPLHNQSSWVQPRWLFFQNGTLVFGAFLRNR